MGSTVLGSRTELRIAGASSGLARSRPTPRPRLGTTSILGRLLVLLLLCATVACVSGAPKYAPSAPALVPLAAIDPTIAQDPRYAGPANFVGRPVRGYDVAAVVLTREAALALSRAQRAARERGYSLLVFDGYRPQRAVDHFVAWGADLDDISTAATYYPNVPKAELFARGYIAERSGHSRGSTVDLTLMRDGEPLPMGTPFDFFDERSHTEHPATAEQALRNRLLLREIMEGAGFRNYTQEWWHYTLVDEPYPDTYFDLSIGEVVAP